jgi:hypothetical protein
MLKKFLQLCNVNPNKNLARSSCFNKCGKTDVAEVIGDLFYNFLLRMHPQPPTQKTGKCRQVFVFDTHIWIWIGRQEV